MTNDQLLQLEVRAAPDGGDARSSGWRGLVYSRLLHRAVSRGSAEGVAALTEQGARSVIDTRDEIGLTPIHRAVLLTEGHGREAVVRTLSKAGADLEAIFEGLRPLHMAAYVGHDRVLQVLLDEGVDRDATTAEGFTALHCAARKGGIAALKVLVRAGADVNARSTGLEKRTPLHAAAVLGSLAMVEALLQHGAGVDMPDADRTTALHIACARGNISLARCLLEAGAAVGSRNVDGDTPLHMACMSLEHRAVRLLLCRGGDETAMNGDNSTPADMLRHNFAENARVTGNFTLVQMIRAMLARAPADRAWRRRRCIVQARAMIQRQRARDEHGDHHVATTPASALPPQPSPDARAIGQCNNRLRCPRAADDGEILAENAWRSSVAWVVGVQEDGIFRHIVAFI